MPAWSMSSRRMRRRLRLGNRRSRRRTLFIQPDDPAVEILLKTHACDRGGIRAAESRVFHEDCDRDLRMIIGGKADEPGMVLAMRILRGAGLPRNLDALHLGGRARPAGLHDGAPHPFAHDI